METKQLLYWTQSLKEKTNNANVSQRVKRKLLTMINFTYSNVSVIFLNITILMNSINSASNVQPLLHVTQLADVRQLWQTLHSSGRCQLALVAHNTLRTSSGPRLIIAATVPCVRIGMSGTVVLFICIELCRDPLGLVYTYLLVTTSEFILTVFFPTKFGPVS